MYYDTTTSNTIKLIRYNYNTHHKKHKLHVSTIKKDNNTIQNSTSIKSSTIDHYSMPLFISNAMTNSKQYNTNKN